MFGFALGIGPTFSIRLLHKILKFDDFGGPDYESLVYRVSRDRLMPADSVALDACSGGESGQKNTTNGNRTQGLRRTHGQEETGSRVCW